MSYERLDAAASHLAHRLIASGGASGDRIAILMAHDVAAIAAVVGVVKAGRIVVALNPGDPPSRLTMLVEDSNRP